MEQELRGKGEHRRLRRETWAALEQLRRDGVARTIGVSNFSERHLRELLSCAAARRDGAAAAELLPRFGT